MTNLIEKGNLVCLNAMAQNPYKLVECHLFTTSFIIH